MGRGKSGQQHQGKKTGVTVLAVIALVCVAAWLSRFAVAKYYAIRDEAGISVASGFYFNSDRLLKPEIAGTASPETVKNMSLDGLPVITNKDKWTGGADCLFTLEVRNYDNKLLYNEADLEVGYRIYFRLVGAPVGATYEVTSVNAEHKLKNSVTNVEGQTQTLGQGTVLECDGSLGGGTAREDRYEIRIRSSSNGTYDNDNCAKVLVFAYPTSPSYIAQSESQEHRLVGVFQAVKSAANMTIESSWFDVEKKAAYQTGNWKNAVKDETGLIYTIRTGGDALIDNNTNSVNQKAYVRWKKEYLTISKYDECCLVLERKKERARERAEATARAEGKTAEQITAAGDAAVLQVETSEGNDWDIQTKGEWNELRLDALPNTEINITFYKTKKLVDEINNSSLSETAFRGLVEAYIPQS